MDITNPRLLKLKGILFFVLGFLAVGILLARVPSWINLLLIGIAIWAFCRFYYFAFYVLHHYADPNFKYTGLLDMAQYLWGGDAKPARRPRRED